MGLSEKEIINFVEQMKDLVFESHENDGDMVSGQVKDEIFKMITGDFENDTTMTNVQYEALLTEIIARLTTHLQEKIEGLPEKLAIKFSFDVISQVVVASYEPEEPDFDPMFG
jgi:hypothetical protein